MDEEVKFIHGNDRINQLAQRPDIAEGVSRIRAEIDKAGPAYAMGLAAAKLYWAVHEARYPSRPGDDVPEGKAYDSMEDLLADLDTSL